jgi:hypothetical protein
MLFLCFVLFAGFVFLVVLCIGVLLFWCAVKFYVWWSVVVL